MSERNDRFRRGAGTYTCEDCGKLTRDTGLVKEGLTFEVIEEGNGRWTIYLLGGFMNKGKALAAACDLLIRRVRFEEAAFSLNDDPCAGSSVKDTEAIKKATSLYTESWIVPILKAIRDGNTTEIKRWVKTEGF